MCRLVNSVTGIFTLLIPLAVHFAFIVSPTEANILNTGTDCGFCPPLLLGEGWGEGFQKSANRDRSQYMWAVKYKIALIVAFLEGKSMTVL